MPCCHSRTSDHETHGAEQVKEFPEGVSSSSNSCCLERPMPTEADAHSHIVDEDIEYGFHNLERIVLTIDGLKCGCCESGISKALRQIPAIKNHQVNLVLARVDCDIDTSCMSVADVTSQLNKTTGFTFQKHDQPESQILEVLVDDPGDLYRAGRPFGVTLIDSGSKQMWNPGRLLSGRSSAAPTEVLSPISVHKSTDSSLRKSKRTSVYQHSVQIHYNATEIGPRDVFQYYQQLTPSQNIQLAPPSTHPSFAIGARQTKRACLLFLVSLLLTIPVLVFAWRPFGHKSIVYAHISLAFATIVQIIATHEFVPGALRSLIRTGLFEMDFLIALSTATAYIFSVVSYVFQLQGHPLETGSFFETSTLLTVLIFLGRIVSEFARLRAAKSVSIRSLQTENALILLPGGPMGPSRETTTIDARLLQYGDVFKVPPHSKIVTDGKVIYGGSEVDESMITGESIPVAKGLDQLVHAGTTNGAGQLIVALTKLPHENSISRIAAMVENAKLSKPKIQALADLIAGWFVPVMAAIGTVVLLIWILVSRYKYHHSWQKSVVKAITYAIATLVVSCPCAIGLAVPMVILIAGGVSARFGIIFRDPQKLEVACNVTDVVFDKTGTLTTGNLAVVDGQIYGAQQDHVINIIAGLLDGDKHPVATAVLQWLKETVKTTELGGFLPVRMEKVTSVPGSGLIGVCKESKAEVRAGNPQWLEVAVLESQHTVFCVTVAGVLRATFRLQDHTRPGADEVLGILSQRGVSIHMISGDGEGAVNEIAHTLDIPKYHTRWRFKPDNKQRYIHELQKEGKVVLFCGDGTNDSAALKQADVGVHINHGSDVAKSAADVVLMKAHLYDILILLDISKAAYRRIILNFGWSFIYNLVAVLMAAGAFVRVRIEPRWAGLGELVSVVPVVLIAFQLRWRDYGRRYRNMERGMIGESDGSAFGSGLSR